MCFGNVISTSTVKTVISGILSIEDFTTETTDANYLEANSAANNNRSP